MGPRSMHIARAFLHPSCSLQSAPRGNRHRGELSWPSCRPVRYPLPLPRSHTLRPPRRRGGVCLAEEGEAGERTVPQPRNPKQGPILCTCALFGLDPISGSEEWQIYIFVRSGGLRAASAPVVDGEHSAHLPRSRSMRTCEASASRFLRAVMASWFSILGRPVAALGPLLTIILPTWHPPQHCIVLCHSFRTSSCPCRRSLMSASASSHTGFRPENRHSFIGWLAGRPDSPIT